METIPVVELTRGCMYVDRNWIGCSRLAYTMVRLRVGNAIQMHTRCRRHEGLLSYGVTGEFQVINFVHPNHLRLGYKP